VLRLAGSGASRDGAGSALRSLPQWVREGKIVPDHVIPGGHVCWDVDRVRHELRTNIARRHHPG
jgi:hypothetical protein